jgi:hypothetical protein
MGTVGASTTSLYASSWGLTTASLGSEEHDGEGGRAGAGGAQGQHSVHYSGAAHSAVGPESGPGPAGGGSRGGNAHAAADADDAAVAAKGEYRWPVTVIHGADGRVIRGKEETRALVRSRAKQAEWAAWRIGAVPASPAKRKGGAPQKRVVVVHRR